MGKKAKREFATKQNASKPASKQPSKPVYKIEFTERDSLLADEVAAHLCAWACHRWGLEPTADNMRTVYALAADHAGAAIEMREFARNPLLTQR